MTQPNARAERTEPATGECLTCNGRGGTWNCMGLAPEGCLCGVCTDNATCPGCGAEATGEPAWLPPANNEEREHPGHGQPMEGAEFPADGTEHELTEPAPDDGSDVGVAFDPREPLMPPRAARAERTEPATGEDVAGLAQVIEDRLRDLGVNGRDQEDREDGSLWLENVDGTADDLANAILAALDLPGRVEALREEQNQARSAVESYEELYERRTAERDAANAALADVARLLDEARMERDAARAEVAEAIAQRLEKLAPLIDGREKPSVALEVAAAMARQHAGGAGGTVSDG